MKRYLPYIVLFAAISTTSCDSDSISTDDCYNVDCGSHGHCVMHEDVSECKCDKGYIADNINMTCVVDKSICENENSCKDGQCLFDSSEQPYCECPDGYVANNSLLQCNKVQNQTGDPNTGNVPGSGDEPTSTEPTKPVPGDNNLSGDLPSDYGKDCTNDSQCEAGFCDSYIGRKCSRRCLSDDDCKKDGLYCRDDGRCAPTEFVTRWKPIEKLTLGGKEFQNVVVFPFGNGHCDYTIHYSDGTEEKYPKCPAFSSTDELSRGHIHSFKSVESDGLVTIKVTGKIENWTCGIIPNIEPSHIVNGYSCDNACKVYVGDLGNCGSKSYCALTVNSTCKESGETPNVTLIKTLCSNLVSVESFGPVKLAPFTFYNAKSLKKISGTDIPDSTNLTSLMFAFYHTDNLDEANIELWDTSNVTTMRGTFFDALKFNTNIDMWDTSNVTDMKWMFKQASAFNSPLNHWDVSKVTDMQCMFNVAEAFNQPLNLWNTENVKDMTYMFTGAKSFDSDISTWKTSKLTALTSMFASTKFNQPIGDWDVQNVTGASRFLWGNKYFNQNLNKWNVSKLKIAEYMFYGCGSYNQPMNDWNTISLENMESMFDNAKYFNQPIGKWDTSKVKNMRYLFRDNVKFNQDISTWNTENVEIMGGIFYKATGFNKDIGNWNTSKVVNLRQAFENASKFDQDLSKWNVEKVDLTKTDKGITPNQTLFYNSGMSKENYCKLYKIPVWKKIIDDAKETKLYDCSK